MLIIDSLFLLSHLTNEEFDNNSPYGVLERP